MTDRQILNLFKNCDFSYGISYENYEETILECLPEDFKFAYNYGVSKLVILPEHENFVIKIPFSGVGLKCEKPFEYANEDNQHCWDYCATEILYYHAAKTKFRAAPVLAKPRFVGYVSGYPIYVQQKAVTFGERYGDRQPYIMEDSAELRYKKSIVRSTCNSTGMYIFNMKWLTDVLDYYGEKQFDIFVNFINTLSDLHNQNIGYIGDRPVIIDFSDWNDNNY